MPPTIEVQFIIHELMVAWLLLPVTYPLSAYKYWKQMPFETFPFTNVNEVKKEVSLIFFKLLLNLYVYMLYMDAVSKFRYI